MPAHKSQSAKAKGDFFSRIKVSFRIYLCRTDMGMTGRRLCYLYPELLRRPRRRRMPQLVRWDRVRWGY